MLVLVEYGRDRVGRQLLVDRGEFRERLDREHRDLLLGDELAHVLWEREDRQVLTDALLAGAALGFSAETFGYAANVQAQVDHRLETHRAPQRVQVLADLILDHRVGEEIELLGLVSRTGGQHRRRDLRECGYRRRVVAPLTGDQHVLTRSARADPHCLEASALAHRLRHRLQLRVVGDLAARVEPLGYDDPRQRDLAQLHTTTAVTGVAVAGVLCCAGSHLALLFTSGSHPLREPIPTSTHAQRATIGRVAPATGEHARPRQPPCWRDATLSHRRSSQGRARRARAGRG